MQEGGQIGRIGTPEKSRHRGNNAFIRLADLCPIAQAHTARPCQHDRMPTHAVTWIDHKEARIFHVHPDSTEETTILAPQHHLHRHPKGHGEPAPHPDDANRFFKEVARALEGADALLIVGPATAKLEFFRYLHEHHRRMEAIVVGVESADHPTDGEIVARAKRAFAQSDRMA